MTGFKTCGMLTQYVLVDSLSEVSFSGYLETQLKMIPRRLYYNDSYAVFKAY